MQLNLQVNYKCLTILFNGLTEPKFLFKRHIKICLKSLLDALVLSFIDNSDYKTFGLFYYDTIKR